jgi:hypothetical protein
LQLPFCLKAWHGLVGEVSRERQVPREEIIDAGWIPPGEGFVKVNWAVFVELDSSHCFMGVVIRNHGSHVMGAMVMKLPELPKGIHPNVSAVIQY